MSRDAGNTENVFQEFFGRANFCVNHFIPRIRGIACRGWRAWLFRRVSMPVRGLIEGSIPQGNRGEYRPNWVSDQMGALAHVPFTRFLKFGDSVCDVSIPM